MNAKTASMAAAPLICASLMALSAPANATIILADASDFQGEIVLIDGNPGDTGGVIFGHTNQSDVGVTYDGLGQTLVVGGSGQSAITGTDLTKLSYYLTLGGTFNNTEFKISGATDTIDFNVVDDSGVSFLFSDVTLDPSGFIAFRGIDGQSIRSVSFLVDDGGTFTEFRQLRLEVSPIPEPATWAMMVAGFGLVGGAIRRRANQARIFA